MTSEATKKGNRIPYFVVVVVVASSPETLDHQRLCSSMMQLM